MRKNQNIGIVIIVLLLLLLGIMILAFTNISPETVVNLEDKTSYIIGEQQKFRVLLQTVDPAQFISNLTFREQYGRWRLEDLTGDIISTGTSRKIDKGIYDTILTVEIPKQPSILVVEIIEFQYSRASTDGKFFIDDGTIRIAEKFPLDVQKCLMVTDCKLASKCQGQFDFCNPEGYCELGGICQDCDSDLDCTSTETEGYSCIDSKCRLVQETTFETQLVDLNQQLLQPGRVTPGEPLAPKQAPEILKTAVLLNSLVLGFLLFRRKK